MRKTCREIQVSLAYRWVLGIAMDEEVPNYSTCSQNYIRRYGESDVFNQIFDQILKQALEYDFVDTETVFGDHTHQKANANKLSILSAVFLFGSAAHPIFSMPFCTNTSKNMIH